MMQQGYSAGAAVLPHGPGFQDRTERRRTPMVHRSAWPVRLMRLLVRSVFKLIKVFVLLPLALALMFTVWISVRLIRG